MQGFPNNRAAKPRFRPHSKNQQLTRRTNCLALGQPGKLDLATLVAGSSGGEVKITIREWNINHGLPLSSTAPADVDEPRETVGVELLRKASVILELLQQGGEWSAQQLAAAAGEPVSSTYRMIANLRKIGLVVKGVSRNGFRLGLYCMSLGAVCDDRISLRDASAPWLDWLRNETSATSFLIVRNGCSAVCIDRVVGQGVRTLALRLGGSLPLYDGAGPRALLAFLPETERRNILAEFEELATSDPGIPNSLLIERQIDQIRSSGISISDEDVTPGIAAIGAPVFNHRGEVEAAVSVSTSRTRLLHDRQHNISRVLRAAREIGRRLGLHVPSDRTKQRHSVSSLDGA